MPLTRAELKAVIEHRLEHKIELTFAEVIAALQGAPLGQQEALVQAINNEAEAAIGHRILTALFQTRRGKRDAEAESLTAQLEDRLAALDPWLLR